MNYVCVLTQSIYLSSLSSFFHALDQSWGAPILLQFQFMWCDAVSPVLEDDITIYQTWNESRNGVKGKTIYHLKLISGEAIYHFHGYEKPSAIATVTGSVAVDPRHMSMVIGLLSMENLPKSLYSTVVPICSKSSIKRFNVDLVDLLRRAVEI